MPPTNQTPDLAYARVRIRRATTEDAADLQAMVEEIAAEEGHLTAVHVTAHHWSRMLCMPEVIVLLAIEDEQPVGYVSAIRQLSLWQGRDILALDDLFVRAHARNRAVGGELMRQLARFASRDDLLVRWEMEHDNHSAQRFYQRLGARLRPKVIASWSPEDYRRGVDDRAGA